LSFRLLFVPLKCSIIKTYTEMENTVKLSKQQKRLITCIKNFSKWNQRFSDIENDNNFYTQKRSTKGAENKIILWDKNLQEACEMLTVSQADAVIEAMLEDEDTRHLVDCDQYGDDFDYHCIDGKMR